jgi:hypothetical protein
MVNPTIFHGTQNESSDLLSAITRHCTCAYGAMGARTSTCAAHAMLTNDQRALDGLVFERRRWEALSPQAGLRIVRPYEDVA